jgi:hypothetical protein
LAGSAGKRLVNIAIVKDRALVCGELIAARSARIKVHLCPLDDCGGEFDIVALKIYRLLNLDDDLRSQSI